MLQVIPEVIDVGGHRKVKITVRDGEKVIDADCVNPLNSTQRKKVAARLAESCGDAQLAERIEQELLQAIDSIQGSGVGVQGSGEEEKVEVVEGTARLVRPELMVTPEVVGLSVPETVIKGGEARGRWRLYLAWKSGKRESLEMLGRIEIKAESSKLKVRSSKLEEKEDTEHPSGTTNLELRTTNSAGAALWIHPQPNAPGVPVNCMWSSASREKWVKGEINVTAREVFVKLREAFEDYLEVGEENSSKCEVRSSKLGEQGENSSKCEVRSSKLEEQGENSSKCEVRSSKLEEQSGAQATTTTNYELGTTNSSPNPITSTLALWTMLTYCYPAWDAVPYLYIGGPAGSGKTRVFELLSRLVYRPILSSNLSAAALFRTLHDRGGTLLLDEAERLSEGSPEVAEVRSILLAGYKRGGRASRLEPSGDSYQMSEFQVYGPKAIACINALPGPLLSRCIVIQMFRSHPSSLKPKRKIDEKPQRWDQLRDDLHCLALGEMGHAAPTLALLDDVCSLGGRNYEIWQPILALAQLVDPENRTELTGKIEAWAAQIVASSQEEFIPEEDQVLMWVLTREMRDGKEARCKQLLDTAKIMESSLFKNWSPQKVAASLKKYGLKLVRKRAGRFFPVNLEQMKRIEQSYGLDLNSDGREGVAITLVRAY